MTVIVFETAIRDNRCYQQNFKHRIHESRSLWHYSLKSEDIIVSERFEALVVHNRFFDSLRPALPQHCPAEIQKAQLREFALRVCF